jgi:hypothetical protein
MKLKKIAAMMLVLLMGAAMLTGCGKGGSKSSSASFDAAPAEIKAAWDKAVAADKANDYVTAVVGYKDIVRQQDKLQEGQVKAVQEASGKLFQRMVDASSKGDAAARQAIATLADMERKQTLGH